MFQCPICSRLLKSRSGLSGHLQFKHGTKLRALPAAPQQLVPAPIKALEAGVSVGPLEQFIDGLEGTVYFIETDVRQLVLAIEMQEVILWGIDTDVGILQTAIKEQHEQHQEAVELMRQGMAKLTEEVKALSRSIVQLNDKVETLTTDRHPPGFCRERSCKAECYIRLKELEADTEKSIDSRFLTEKLRRLGF